MHLKYVAHTPNVAHKTSNQADSKSKTDNLIPASQKRDTKKKALNKIENENESETRFPQRVIENSGSQIGAVKCQKMQFALRVKCGGSKDEGLSIGGYCIQNSKISSF